MKLHRIVLQPEAEIETEALPVASSFLRQQAQANAVAETLLAEPMLLSWYDVERGIESPNGVSECGHAAPDFGVRQYALSRGGALAVEVELPSTVQGDGVPLYSVFCYLDLGE